MPSVINLPKHEAFTFLNKYNAYKSCSEKKRVEMLLDLLIYTSVKLGSDMTMRIIEKETIDDPIERMMLTTLVAARSARFIVDEVSRSRTA